MSNEETTIWGIHSGRRGEADHLFLKENVVGLGDLALGDLKKITTSRDAFKKLFTKTYPEAKPLAISIWAGQTYRFIHEMNVGDIIVYPSKIDREIHIGRISGNYEFKESKVYPHLRSVEWKKSVPRTSFSQGALYEVGSAQSFFQVKNYADEFREALKGQNIISPVDQDPTIKIVAEDIEETTRDFVLKRLSKELKGHPLSDFVCQLLEIMGYRTRESPEGPDGGVDIIAHKDELGFEPPIIKVQVKSGDSSVGDPVVSALYGKVSNTEFGLLITLGKFTNQAINFARSKSNLRLIDGDELVSLILLHYEQFDSSYKGLLPLKRVYVPELIEEDK
jgi:restriction system protein